MILDALLLSVDYHSWALSPPMGWNSWDCFGTTITEVQAKDQADAMAKHLKPSGWKFFTVDIEWYAPGSEGHVYKEGAPLAMDEFSRLVPATNKFPSATNGKGFKPLADYVHKKGLKFGIHIMRGIARQAVNANTPIEGVTVHAADIAAKNSICPWNPDMYGVDMTKPGAQAYYDSLFAMYASWGVDFVKVDDISRAYDEVQKAEIEAIRRAIDKTGRPIVLSLSPGDTPIERGAHVSQHANMWRISDDFWDRWDPLQGMFARLDRWTPYRLPGAWPDADMLPFGIVEFKRPTKFTKDEQTLCMTLWSIARSPLILGADMTKLDPFTLDLLSNPEVLAVNQSSTKNRQLSRKDNLIVWTAEVPRSDDRYVALFNAPNISIPYDLSKALYKSPIVRGAPGAQVADISTSLGKARKLVLMVTDGGDGFNNDHAAWLQPTLSGPKGTLKLTDLKWNSAVAGWSEVRMGRDADDKPLEVEGIGTHAPSFVEFDIPEGYDTFHAKGVLTAGSIGRGSVEFAVLTEDAKINMPDRSNVSVTLADLGFSGEVRVCDLWKRLDLGTFTTTFAQDIPLHGAGLYRISRAKKK
jgi:hypothetical protein